MCIRDSVGSEMCIRDRFGHDEPRSGDERREKREVRLCQTQGALERAFTDPRVGSVLCTGTNESAPNTKARTVDHVSFPQHDTICDALELSWTQWSPACLVFLNKHLEFMSSALLVRDERRRSLERLLACFAVHSFSYGFGCRAVAVSVPSGRSLNSQSEKSAGAQF
jgi:hypothetical protein